MYVPRFGSRFIQTKHISALFFADKSVDGMDDGLAKFTEVATDVGAVLGLVSVG